MRLPWIVIVGLSEYSDNIGLHGIGMHDIGVYVGNSGPAPRGRRAFDPGR